MNHAIPIVVISLLHATKRRRVIEREFARLGFSFSFFDAIDAATMTAAEVASLSPLPYVGHKDRILSGGEIALALSFRIVLEQFCAGNEPFIAIFEDDATIVPAAAPYLDACVLRRLPEFDVLRLANDPAHMRGFTRVVAIECGHAVHAPLRLGLYALAQVLSRRGARKVIAGMLPLRAPLDCLLYRDVSIHALRVLEVSPAVAEPHKQHSAQGALANRYNHAPARDAWRSPAVVLRHKYFLLARRWRALWSYTGAWGIGAVLQLRPGHFRSGKPRITANNSHELAS